MNLKENFGCGIRKTYVLLGLRKQEWTKTLFCPHDIAAIHWWSRVRLRLRLYNSAIQKSARFCSDNITKWGHLLFHVPSCPFNTSPSIPGHLDFFYFFFVSFSFSSSDFFPSFWSDKHRECAAVTYDLWRRDHCCVCVSKGLLLLDKGWTLGRFSWPLFRPLR